MGRDWVFCRQAKYDGNEGDPQTCDDGEGFGCGTEIEGSALEVSGINEAHGDGNTIRKIETDRGDGSRAVECDGRSKRREGEEERTAGAEEHCTDWGVEATVDYVKSVRNTAVTGEGEHHAGVGCLDTSV